MDHVVTSARPSRLRVELLHQFRLLADEADVALSEGSERLVAFLALEDRPRSRADVAAVLWPDRGESDAASCLRRALWRLNRDAPGLVDRRGQRIGLCPDVDVDLREVTRLAEAAQRGAQHVSAHAVRLLEGDLLPQWSFEWLDLCRESVRQVRLHALEELARNDVDAGRPAGALTAALAAAGVDPLRESAQRIVLAAHLAEGNVAEAVRQFVHYRDLLWEEMRLRPSAQLVAMLPDGLGTVVRFDTRAACPPA